MSTPSQDYAATITWTQDWTQHLSTNGLTISAVVSAVCTNNAVTVASPTVTGNGTGVTFKVSQTGLSTPTTVVIDVKVALSNGDTDVRDFLIQFTDT